MQNHVDVLKEAGFTEAANFLLKRRVQEVPGENNNGGKTGKAITSTALENATKDAIRVFDGVERKH